MKPSKLVLLPAFAMMLPLAGCTFADDGWKEYYTPELFLNHARVHNYVTVESTGTEGKSVKDYELAIKDAILENQYESVKSAKPTSTHYFTYKILIALATTGPNYSNMYVYDDGLLRIDFKASLGKLHTFYYTFDADAASSLVDYVDGRLTEIREAEAEDYAQAQEDGGIANLLNRLQPTYTIPIHIWQNNQGYDSPNGGLLLDQLKGIAFTRSETTNYLNEVMCFNTGMFDGRPTVPDWYFFLYEGYDMIEVYYAYKNRYDWNSACLVRYSLDAAAGQSLFNAALEIARQ